MRQVTAKKILCTPDISASAVLDAITLLYNPSFERPLEDTRFTVLLPDCFVELAIFKSEELRHFNIDWIICQKGVMQAWSWIVVCQDSGAILTCEGA